MIDINAKIMEAMKAKDRVASETYKLLKARILEFKTAKNARDYTESEEITLINKMISDRTTSIELYLQNNRQDLADDEYAQIRVLQSLLPELPTKEDIEIYVNDKFPNGINKKEMGLVIKEIKETLVGADGKTIADVVKRKIVE